MPLRPPHGRGEQDHTHTLRVVEGEQEARTTRQEEAPEPKTEHKLRY